MGAELKNISKKFIHKPGNLEMKILNWEEIILIQLLSMNKQG